MAGKGGAAQSMYIDETSGEVEGWVMPPLSPRPTLKLWSWKVALFVLSLSAAAAIQLLLLRAAIAALAPPIAIGTTHADAAPTVPSITNDGLVWITPKPPRARRVGWEDEWMMRWKERHYATPSQRRGPHCNITHDTPYEDDLLCTIPGYVPARYYVPSSNPNRVPPPSIPRVIFVSWFDRRLGKAMYTSLLTLLHHNPEYEFIFFDDEDVERFICDNVGSSEDDFAVPLFSKARSGALRADIWRLLVLRSYGGVYLDSDVSALTSLPIRRDDTAVSGLGCWSHLPTETGGVLEHWAMAFMPRHPFVNRAVEVMTENLQRPEYFMREDTPEARAEDSWTMRVTGPAMYQWALHDVLERSQCKPSSDNDYCLALLSPERHCEDMTTFRSFFPNGTHLVDGANWGGNVITHKMMHRAHSWEEETEEIFDLSDYDDTRLHLSKTPDLTFCSQNSFAKRSEARARTWEANVEKKKD